jgi:hypothetical protein
MLEQAASLQFVDKALLDFIAWAFSPKLALNRVSRLCLDQRNPAESRVVQ